MEWGRGEQWWSMGQLRLDPVDIVETVSWSQRSSGVRGGGKALLDAVHPRRRKGGFYIARQRGRRQLVAN